MKKIYFLNINAPETTIQMAGMQMGVYYIKATDNQGRTLISKVLKKKYRFFDPV